MSGVDADMWSFSTGDCGTMRAELSMSDGDAETSLPDTSSSKPITAGATDFLYGFGTCNLSMPGRSAFLTEYPVPDSIFFCSHVVVSHSRVHRFIKKSIKSNSNGSADNYRIFAEVIW